MCAIYNNCALHVIEYCLGQLQEIVQFLMKPNVNSILNSIFIFILKYSTWLCWNILYFLLYLCVLIIITLKYSKWLCWNFRYFLFYFCVLIIITLKYSTWLCWNIQYFLLYLCLLIIITLKYSKWLCWDILYFLLYLCVLIIITLKYGKWNLQSSSGHRIYVETLIKWKEYKERLQKWFQRSETIATNNGSRICNSLALYKGGFEGNLLRCSNIWTDSTMLVQ